MSDNNHILYKILFIEFQKVAVWSFQLAWKTFPRLFLAIITCFSFEVIIPVSVTTTIVVLVSKYSDAASQSSADLKHFCSCFSDNVNFSKLLLGIT